MDSNRPLRSIAESLTDRIPNGPAGFVGDGNLVGLVGFSGVTLVNQFSPIPLGNTIQTSSVKEEGDGMEVHEYEIWSASRDVARFVALRESSGPNLNLFSDISEVLRVEEKLSRAGHSLWFVRVEVERTNTVEDEDIRVSRA